MLKAVVFDVGGVLLVLGEAAYRQALCERLGLSSVPPQYEEAVPYLQRGELDEQEFWMRLSGTLMFG